MKVINQLPSNYIEHEYFNEMLRYFEPDVFHDKTVIISHNYKVLPEYGKHVVAILTAGDEKGIPPSYSNKVGIVFKHHLDSDNVGNNWHIPLTYVQGFNQGYDKPILDRPYDIFFIGRRSRRNDFIEKVEKFMKQTKFKYNWCWKINGHKFMKGIPIGEYAELMANSKIVLSPQGAVRAECLRFTEAVKAGCAIIACKHPNCTIFNKTPARYISDWDHAGKHIDDLLSDPEELKHVYSQTRRMWDDYYSPRAVGEYITRITRCNLT